MYLVWSISNKSIPMVCSLEKLATLTVAIFIAGSALAEFDADASVSMSLAGSDDDVQLTVNPVFSASYQAKNANGRTVWTTGFLPLGESWWNGQWTADNQLQWATDSQQLSGSFGYVHSEADVQDSPLKNDVVQVGLNINLPWAPTFRNIVAVGANWQQVNNTESDQVIDDTIVTGSYSLSWQATKHQAFQMSISQQNYESGADITGLQTQWQISGAQASLNTAVTFNNTQQENTDTQFLGGQLVVNHQSDFARASVGVERAQTDALTQFEISFIDETILQQSQILLTELSAEVTDIKLFRTMLISLNYRAGNTESLQRISIIDFEDTFESVFLEAGMNLLVPFANQSTLAAAVEYSQQNNDAVTSGSVSYGKSFNRQLSFGANYSQNLSAESNYRWMLSLNYAL